MTISVEAVAAALAIKSQHPAPAILCDGATIVLSYTDDAHYSARTSLDVTAIRALKGVKVASIDVKHNAPSRHGDAVDAHTVTITLA